MMRATSREAYASLEDFIGPLMARVYRAIVQHQRVTDEELVELTGLTANTCRPRRYELEKLGLIRESAVCGVTKSGRRAIRWEVVPRG